jgi:integrase
LTKSRKNRVLPMRDVVWQELQALHGDVPKVLDAGSLRPKHPHCFTWDHGVPYLADWVTHEFARIVKRAGIPRCTPHDLRRSFSTLAQRAGVDKSVVKDLGGWSCVRVAENHYTGDVSEVLQRAMKQIAGAQAASG